MLVAILFVSVGICAIIEMIYYCHLMNRIQQRNDTILKLTKEIKNISEEMTKQLNDPIMLIPKIIELLYCKGVITEKEYKHIVENMQGDKTFADTAKAIDEVCNDD